MLKHALDDVETTREKWWCVAARYMELRKGREGLRVLGKVDARKWCETIKKEKSGVENDAGGGGAKRVKVEAIAGRKEVGRDEGGEGKYEDK